MQILEQCSGTGYGRTPPVVDHLHPGVSSGIRQKGSWDRVGSSIRIPVPRVTSVLTLCIVSSQTRPLCPKSRCAVSPAGTALPRLPHSTIASCRHRQVDPGSSGAGCSRKRHISAVEPCHLDWACRRSNRRTDVGPWSPLAPVGCHIVNDRR